MDRKTFEKMCVCGGKLHKTSIKYKGILLEGEECSKCHEKMFSEEQATKAIDEIEQHDLKEKYVKHPVKIGNSWGVIFPNEVSKKFQLNQKKTELIIHPMLSKKMIELQIE
ncbi:MAG: hypothetical protein AABW72_00320 [archaeon]